MTTHDDRRARMVEQQIAARGITDPSVLEAMRAVPRHRFVPESRAQQAYEDAALPIGEEQTISQPCIVAAMIEAAELRQDARVLEIGTGSGYAAAVIGRIAMEVHSVERIGRLAEEAAERLREEGVRNVHVHHGDGTRGWPMEAPYDAILVAASAPHVPKALCSQLVPGGRIVMPLGDPDSPGGQALTRLTLVGPSSWDEKRIGSVRFVPLIGE
ncbi:protein-L-isoaspartate(D-aspartate) O-methyltransferase [Wenxinia saemankumensis]|uniref:Protein-L-isoaspartate O-methyltransferase n=1 Tax=Wenxinia saemankumensis TaxID=1447782 RepID=A0A1M6HTJ8_9RHOB|nr:protein-L-isoaspartate(D-aspartate) O-methyltransferase [Wenxinia saemankumensis]SHJ25542.1 protein-L-isoaspartate(D-aspartate) O-methyltransferase [Wenxinia saemankumensis]